MKQYVFYATYRTENGIESKEWKLSAESYETLLEMVRATMCAPITGKIGEVLYWAVFDGYKAIVKHQNEYAM